MFISSTGNFAHMTLKRRLVNSPDPFAVFFRHGAELWNLSGELQELVDVYDEMPLRKRLKIDAGIRQKTLAAANKKIKSALRRKRQADKLRAVLQQRRSQRSADNPPDPVISQSEAIFASGKEYCCCIGVWMHCVYYSSRLM